MSNATPDPILQLLGAHLTAKYVFVGVETGVFEQLAAGRSRSTTWRGASACPSGRRGSWRMRWSRRVG